MMSQRIASNRKKRNIHEMRLESAGEGSEDWSFERNEPKFADFLT